MNALEHLGFFFRQLMFLEVEEEGQVSKTLDFQLHLVYSVRFLQSVCFISLFVKTTASSGTNRNWEICVCQGQVNEQLGKGALLPLLH